MPSWEPLRPSRSRFALVLLLVCGLPPVTAPAADDDYDETRLCTLFESGRSAEAFAYGLRHRDRHEGEAGFDYCYGAAAIDAGKVSEGIFALERVLLLHPGHMAARLELARGYFLLEEYARARDEFEQVLSADPPREVRVNIARYLRAIRLQEGRYLTTSSAFLQIGGGYDGNVNSGPDDRTIHIPALGTGLLANSSLSQKSPFAGLAGAYRVTTPLSRPGWALYGGLVGEGRHYTDATRFDYLTISGRGGIERRKEYHRFRVGLLGQSYILDGSAYRNLLGIEGEWKYQADPALQWQAFVQITGTEYPDQELRDSLGATLGAGFTRNARGPLYPIFFGNLYVGAERARQDSSAARLLASRRFAGGTLGAQLTLAPSVSLTARLMVSRDRYDELDILFLDRRSDLLGTADLRLAWLFADRWSLVGTLGYTRNDANLDIYDYDRWQTAIHLRRDF